MPPLIENDHNVYILGAGFSYDAGLPLVSDFLVKMRDSHDWLVEQNRKKEAEAVAEVLRFRLDAASAAYWVPMDIENIEELFSLASATRGDMNEHIRLAIAATLDFAQRTKKPTNHPMFITGDSKVFPRPLTGTDLKHPHWVKYRGQVPDLSASGARGPYEIEWYAYATARMLGMFQGGNPQGRNTFITFNYDTILEEALRSLDLSFCYGFRAGTVNFDASAAQQEKPGDSAIRVLKLHGSVNWGRPDSPGSRLTIYRDYNSARELGLVPELVPPTWKKVFENQLEAIWEGAVSALNTATRIIILGFSMPPTDMHFKYLLAAGLQKNVSLRRIWFVNPDIETLKARAQKLLHSGYIESKLIAFEKAYLNGFAHGPGMHQTIGRPLEEGIGYL